MDYCKKWPRTWWFFVHCLKATALSRPIYSKGCWQRALSNSNYSGWGEDNWATADRKIWGFPCSIIFCVSFPSGACLDKHNCLGMKQYVRRRTRVESFVRCLTSWKVWIEWNSNKEKDGKTELLFFVGFKKFVALSHIQLLRKIWKKRILYSSTCFVLAKGIGDEFPNLVVKSSPGKKELIFCQK